MSITAERITELRRIVAMEGYLSPPYANKILDALEEALREGERPCAKCGLDRAEASKADSVASAFTVGTQYRAPKK